VHSDETEIRDLRNRLIQALAEVDRVAKERDDAREFYQEQAKLLSEITKENTALRQANADLYNQANRGQLWRQG
jgi:uncharacterized protein YukE